MDRVLLFAPAFPHPARTRKLLDRLHAACLGQQVLQFGYTSEEGVATERSAHPLGLYFWGNRWTVVAWCTTRADFRQFRLDRMREVEVLDERFPTKRGRQLSDFLRKVRQTQPVIRS